MALGTAAAAKAASAASVITPSLTGQALDDMGVAITNASTAPSTEEVLRVDFNFEARELNGVRQIKQRDGTFIDFDLITAALEFQGFDYVPEFKTNRKGDLSLHLQVGWSNV